METNLSIPYCSGPSPEGSLANPSVLPAPWSLPYSKAGPGTLAGSAVP